MTQIMNIKPGIGIGDIKFGIIENDLIKILGDPEFISENEYVENSGEVYRELFYSNGLSFTFDADDNFRLGTIFIDRSGYTLFGKDLIGQPMKDVRALLSKEILEVPKVEDWSSEENPNYILLDFDSISMLLWFKNDLLDNIQYGYLFAEDHETIIWPE